MTLNPASAGNSPTDTAIAFIPFIPFILVKTAFFQTRIKGMQTMGGQSLSALRLVLGIQFGVPIPPRLGRTA